MPVSLRVKGGGWGEDGGGGEEMSREQDGKEGGEV